MADGMPHRGTGFTVGDGQPDRKRPLFRTLPPAPVFPLQALGGLRQAAEGVHDATQAPVAVCAQSVLAGATLAVQAHWDVLLPGAGRRPLTGLFVSVLDSGERKSAVDRLAVWPAYEVEQGFRDAARAEVAAYTNAKEAWDACRADGLVRLAASVGPWHRAKHDDVTQPLPRLPFPGRGDRACGLALSLLRPQPARR